MTDFFSFKGLTQDAWTSGIKFQSIVEIFENIFTVQPDFQLANMAGYRYKKISISLSCRRLNILSH